MFELTIRRLEESGCHDPDPAEVIAAAFDAGAITEGECSSLFPYAREAVERLRAGRREAARAASAAGAYPDGGPKGVDW